MRFPYTARVRPTNLGNQADKEFDPGDRMGLAVSYARLGKEKAAMREFATATTDMQRSHADFDEGVALALIQLALSQKAAAIDSLGQYMALQTKDGRSDRKSTRLNSSH